MMRSFSLIGRIAVISSLFLVLLMPALAGQGLVGAAPLATVTLRAEALWKGYYREGGWAVIDVDVFNPGLAFDAEISISAPLGYDQRRTDFRRPITVAPNTSSRYRLYICLIQQARDLSVTLNSEDGQVLGQTGVQVLPVDYGNYMVAAIGNTVPVATPGVGVTPVLFGSQKRVQTLSLTPDLLPDRPEGLGAFNAIVLRDIGINQLSSDQYNALLNWTLAGGRLIFAPPDRDNWVKLFNVFGAQLMPADLVGDEKIIKLDAKTTIFELLNSDHEAVLTPIGSNNLKILGLEAKPQSRLITDLKQSDGQLQPLVITAKVGKGSTVATATDPFLPTMAAANTYWNNLLNSLASTNTYDPSNENILQDPTLARAFLNEAAIQTESTPFNLLFWGGLGAYLLLALPLNFLLWRKSRRPELALLTLPVSAALVSIGLIVVSSNQQFTGIQRLDVVQFNNTVAESNAWVSSYMAMRSTNDSGCVLSFKGEQPLLRPIVINAASTPGAREADDKGFIRSPQELSQQPYTANCDSTAEGAFKLLTLEDWQKLRQPIDGKLQLNGPALTGKLTNRANYNLESAVLVLGENYQMLGQWKAQQQLDINFKLDNLPGNFSVASTSVANFLKNNPQTAISDSVYYAMLGTTTHVGRFGTSDQTASAYIIGWARDLLSDNISVNQTMSSNRDLSLIIQPVQFQLVAQAEKSVSQPTYQIPPQLFMPRLVQNDAQSVQNGEALNAGGTQIREYQLPIQTPLNTQPQNLTINLATAYSSSAGTQNLSSVPEVDLYNWRTQEWRVLANEDMQTLVISSSLVADEFEPQTHAFRLRLKSSQRVHLIQKFNVSLSIK